MELFKANKQWSTRPDDERFDSIEALYNATKAYADSAREKQVNVSDIRVEANGTELAVTGKAKLPAQFSHWSFGQLCNRVGAPASYMRALPATLAAQNLNYGLANYADKAEHANLLFHQNGSLLLRAFTSDKYARIWNYEVADRLRSLETYGWKPATPDIRVIDDKLPLYASDHDMFAFVKNDSSRISEPGNPDGLQRGVIVENSEVGASALKLTRFLYREMCGNHIIWGASNVVELAVRHIGNARSRWSSWSYALKQYAESSAHEDEAKIARAKTFVLGQTKDEVLDKLFGIRSLAISRKMLEAGYDANVPDTDGAPNTVWGMLQGLTRASQTTPYADVRTDIDRNAGKLMELVF